MKWDRSESLTVVSLNVPGQVNPTFKRLRIPLTVLNKKFCTPASLDKVLEYISWSLALLIQDAFPSSDPNGKSHQQGLPGGRKELVGLWAVMPFWERFEEIGNAGVI